MTDRTAQETVLAFFGALGSGDFAALPVLAAEGIVYTIYGEHEPARELLSWSGRHEGIPALEAAFRAIQATLDVHLFDVETVIGEGDTVAVFGRYEATARSTGRGFTTPFAQRVRLSDGKVADCVMLEDSRAVAIALSAV